MNRKLKTIIFSSILILFGCSQEMKSNDYSVLVILPPDEVHQADKFNCSIVIPNINTAEIKNLTIENNKKGDLVLKKGVFYWKGESREKKGSQHFKGFIEFTYYGEKIKLHFDKTYHVESPIAVVNTPLFGNILIKEKKNPIHIAISGIAKKKIVINAENAKITSTISYGDTSYFLIPNSFKSVILNVSAKHNGKIRLYAQYSYDVISEESNMYKMFQN